MTEKGKRLGMGAGAFGAAGIIGLFAVGALTAALVLLLATAMETWVAAPSSLPPMPRSPASRP